MGYTCEIANASKIKKYVYNNADDDIDSDFGIVICVASQEKFHFV